MYEYVKPTLENKPDTLVIHVGTNDLREDETPEETAKRVTYLAMSYTNEDTEVIVSSILPRGDNPPMESETSERCYQTIM